MTENQANEHAPSPAWRALAPALHIERQRNVDGALEAITLRHVDHPYSEHIAPTAADRDRALRGVAARYLAQVDSVVGLGAIATQLQADDATDGSFYWLDVAWGGGENRDPRLSFRVGSIWMLLAGNQTLVGGTQRCLGQQTGLRVALHVQTQADGSMHVVITGLSACGLAHAVMPAQAERAPGATANAMATTTTESVRSQQADTTRDVLIENHFRTNQLALTRYLGTQDFTVLGFRAAGTGRSQMSGTLARGRAGAQRVWAWRASLTVAQGGLVAVQRFAQVEQVTHAALAFGRDPASAGPAATEHQRRPSVLTKDLQPFRLLAVALPQDTADPNPLLKRLQDDDPAGPRFEVQRGAVRAPAVQSVPAADLDLRTDDLSAVHAFQRGRELFERMSLYGLPAADFFRQARLPLVLRHRARFNNAPDGNTVNAQVRFVQPTPGLGSAYVTGDWPQLEVGFGAALLSHRPALADDRGIHQAQPLGLAADRRWAWHEFGHVLMAASTGELEFRFAHSIGDALAAIVADPDSELATDVHTAGGADERMRLLTFPWVKLNRSHGRQAELGWCWCGRRSRRRHHTGALQPQLFTDYFEEQLLSSSLFTLYSALGGLPGNSPWRRQTASHYCVNLIMKALLLLGPATVVPALSADAWVSALIEADRDMGDWLVDTATWDPTLDPLRRSCGGGAHKLIRWAFENQGLYATHDPDAVVEGKGLAPPVDVYIPGPGARNGGDYVPVPLPWSHDPDETAPPWHADARALAAVGSELLLSVGNRGADPALHVEARCWVAPAGDTDLEWVACAAVATASQTVNPGATASFRFVRPSLAGPHLVLAQVSCPADRAILDPVTLLPCANGFPPAQANELIDLVAADNNLGLRVIDLS